MQHPFFSCIENIKIKWGKISSQPEQDPLLIEKLSPASQKSCGRSEEQLC